MRSHAFALGASLALALFGAAPVAAQTDSTTVAYELGPASNFETGCFGPCTCPVFMRQLSGTFDLKRASFDPLFTNYTVSQVQWKVPDGTATVLIQGSGTYRVGGEVAVMQQMVLDLSIDGGAPLHFDSGLVQGGGAFPKAITIDISLHQNTACRDTVMHVDATDPVVTSVVAGLDPGRRPAAEAAPNPFQNETAIHLRFPRSGPLSVVIYDVRGRAVRHLASGAWFVAGPRTLLWDGRSDGNAACAAGIYLVQADVGHDRATQRIVKVE